MGDREFGEGFGYHESQRGALGFVLEDESWPVFLAWAKEQHVSKASHKWLESADLATTRVEWLRHSPDPVIRASADWLPA